MRFPPEGSTASWLQVTRRLPQETLASEARLSTEAALLHQENVAVATSHPGRMKASFGRRLRTRSRTAETLSREQPEEERTNIWTSTSSVTCLRVSYSQQGSSALSSAQKYLAMTAINQRQRLITPRSPQRQEQSTTPRARWSENRQMLKADDTDEPSVEAGMNPSPWDGRSGRRGVQRARIDASRSATMTTIT